MGLSSANQGVLATKHDAHLSGRVGTQTLTSGAAKYDLLLRGRCVLPAVRGSCAITIIKQHGFFGSVTWGEHHVDLARIDKGVLGDLEITTRLGGAREILEDLGQISGKIS